MPIAKLFSARPSSNSVGTGRNGRNRQQSRAVAAFRPVNEPVGTVGTAQGWSAACFDRSDPSEQRSEQGEPSVCAAVPTVPTVPTTKHDAADRCRCCGDHLAWPGPVGVILSDGTAECMSCGDREVGRLRAAAERAVASPDALVDPAEVMLRGVVE
jgi:hypothetical protein